MEAWFSTALDIEEVISGTGGDQLRVMVADVIKSCDTVDRSILDCACLVGLVGLVSHFIVRFGFGYSLLRALVNLGVGGIPQGCPLGMVFIVALPSAALCW